MTSIHEKLKQYFENQGISQKEIADKTDTTKQYINAILNGRRRIGRLQAEKMETQFGLSSVWLLTGEGPMLRTASEATPRTDLKHTGVRLVSQYAYAGYLTGYMDDTYMAQLPVIDFTPDREMTGNYLAFEVRGDSMDDGSKEAYVEGELLICREVEPHLWRDSRLHINKRDFVIVHAEGILVKRVIAHDVANHNITIHSLNPLYPDRVIDLAEVRQIFSVVESRKQRSR